MSVNEIFKTEFRGYNKQEVAEYIISLNSQMESLKEELDRCESELEKCRGELSEMETAPKETAVDVDALREQIRTETEAEIRAALEREIRESVEAEVRGVLKSEYDALVAKAEQAQADSVSVSRDELEALREKAEQYDDQKDILAELLIKVRTDAVAIYSEAETKSRDLMTGAFDKFVKLQDDFDVMKKNVEASKADIETRITNIRRALDDFTQYLDFMNQDITNTAENFKENI